MVDLDGDVISTGLKAKSKGKKIGGKRREVNCG
jgi:hypothetical protein